MNVPTFNLSQIPVTAFGIAFLVCFILTILLSLMFIFHWKRYSLNAAVALVVTWGYALITLGLLIMSLSLLGVLLLS